MTNNKNHQENTQNQTNQELLNQIKQNAQYNIKTHQLNPNAKKDMDTARARMLAYRTTQSLKNQPNTPNTE